MITGPRRRMIYDDNAQRILEETSLNNWSFGVSARAERVSKVNTQWIDKNHTHEGDLINRSHTREYLAYLRRTRKLRKST